MPLAANKDLRDLARVFLIYYFMRFYTNSFEDLVKYFVFFKETCKLVKRNFWALLNNT